MITRIALFVGFLTATLCSQAQSPTKIEFKDNWYHLNGQRFFIKAIGYEIGARPGQHPYEGIRADDLDLMAFDLKVIKGGATTPSEPGASFPNPNCNSFRIPG